MMGCPPQIHHTKTSKHQENHWILFRDMPRYWTPAHTLPKRLPVLPGNIFETLTNWGGAQIKEALFFFPPRMGFLLLRGFFRVPFAIFHGS